MALASDRKHPRRKLQYLSFMPGGGLHRIPRLKSHSKMSTTMRIFLYIAVFALGIFFGQFSALAPVQSFPDHPTKITTSLPQSEAIIVTRRKPRDPNGLHLAWLMSFPNSGTSYTMGLAATASKLGIATNYGAETRGEMARVYPDVKGGPWWVPVNKTSRPTSGYVLTKTHCGGRCVKCRTVDDSPSPDMFLYTCLQYTYKSTTPEIQNVYPTERVQKAVHLIRDPVDNVVSRFHHAVQSLRQSKYEISPAGFRSFCAMVDHEASPNPNIPKMLPPGIWEPFSKVPCHTDFFRYARWHENALFMTKMHGIETKLLYYEDYGTRWEASLQELLDFLEQPFVDKKIGHFLKGKNYRHFFTEEELETIHRTLKLIMPTETWGLVAHYFEKDRMVQI